MSGEENQLNNIKSLPEHAYSSVGPQDEPIDELKYFLMVC